MENENKNDKTVENDSPILIGNINPIDDDTFVEIEENTETTGTTSDKTPVPDSLKTGKLISAVFGFAASLKNNDDWLLNESEIKTLNKTCPKILPPVILEHSGLIGCALSVMGMFLKRIKRENKEKEPVTVEDIPEPLSDDNEMNEGLTGARTC